MLVRDELVGALANGNDRAGKKLIKPTRLNRCAVASFFCWVLAFMSLLPRSEMMIRSDRFCVADRRAECQLPKPSTIKSVDSVTRPLLLLLQSLSCFDDHVGCRGDDADVDRVQVQCRES